MTAQSDPNFTHTGSCHCGEVKWTAAIDPNPTIMDCNCSICTKKQNRHIIIPRSKFKLIQGEQMLTTYTFNTGLAKHTFCKKCGVQSFYTPRSNPDGIDYLTSPVMFDTQRYNPTMQTFVRKWIMPHCIDSGSVINSTIQYFDGQNHEDAMAKNPEVLVMSRNR